METEKRYKIYYGEGENDYIIRYLTDNQIMDGYLTELAAFNIFYSGMIICNNYLQNNYNNDLEYLIDAYNEEDDYYEDEFQVFIIDPEFDEDVTIAATKKMGNTLYYDNTNELYITGITDLGTSRSIVPTDLKVKEDC